MKRSKLIGLIGTVVLHVAILVFLYLYVLTLPPKQEEGGVPVMLGNTETGEGDADPYTLTEVDLLPQPETAEQEASLPDGGDDSPLITQADEPSLQVKKEEPRQEQKQKETSDVKPKKLQNIQSRKKKPKQRSVPKQNALRHRRLPVKWPELSEKAPRWEVPAMVVVKECKEALQGMEKKERLRA